MLTVLGGGKLIDSFAAVGNLLGGQGTVTVTTDPDAQHVTVDGRPQKVLHVKTQRLYHLLSRPQPGVYDLRLDFSPGVAGYAFTFG